MATIAKAEVALSPSDARRRMLHQLGLHASSFSVRDGGESGVFLHRDSREMLPARYRVTTRAGSKGSVLRLIRLLPVAQAVLFTVFKGTLVLMTVAIVAVLLFGERPEGGHLQIVAGAIALWAALLGMEVLYGRFSSKHDAEMRRMFEHAIEQLTVTSSAGPPGLG